MKHKKLNDFVAKNTHDLEAINDFFSANITDDELLTQVLKEGTDSDLTKGQILADKVARFGGSWTFISLFGVILLCWICTNSFILISRPFDPYPFILLNLVLSCLAAIQAPLIMMSQNRQDEKDRQRAQHDYLINLRAELEIRNLQMNMKKLFDIQNEQIAMLESLSKNKT